MSAAANGGPAFPHLTYDHSAAMNGGVGVTVTDPTAPGMTLRDYFAAKAMAGFAADPHYDATVEAMAEAAYRWADAMLAERAKRGGE